MREWFSFEGSPVRILIAPDKFKGTLSAKEAATAIERGVRLAAGDSIEVEVCPVADGGEGFLDCVRTALEVAPEEVPVSGPLIYRSVTARVLTVPPRTRLDMPCTLSRIDEYKLSKVPGAKERFEQTFEKGTVPCDAYLEAADAVGIRHLVPYEMDPEETSSHGLGQLVRHALELNCRRVFIGLGGSATVDGGAGIASWLGVKFLNDEGADTCGMPSTLSQVQRILALPADDPVRAIEVVALHDVSNPLLGPNGAARVYGPQKGATPEQVERLEAGLTNLVRVCRECGVPCDPDQPGAGSAGGLGFGLATFLGAKLVPGAPFIFDLLKFDERVARADLVITGEGRLDSQTASGKAAAEVARRAAAVGKPCFAVVGSTEGAPDEVRAALAAKGIEYVGVASAVEAAESSEAALDKPGRWLEEAAFRLMRARIEQG